MTAVLTRPLPNGLRVARVVTTLQAATAALVTGAGLVLMVMSASSDRAARQAGRSNDYEGLGVTIGAFLALTFGVVALLCGAAAVGLFRGRVWGLVVAGVAEGLLLAVAAVPSLFVATPFVWVVVMAPAAIVLVVVCGSTARQWCRSAG